MFFRKPLRDWLNDRVVNVSPDAKSVFEGFLHANKITELRQVRDLVPTFWAYIEQEESPVEHARLAEDFFRIQQAIRELDHASTSMSSGSEPAIPFDEWSEEDVCQWITSLPRLAHVFKDTSHKICALIREFKLTGVKLKANPRFIQDEPRFRSIPRRHRLELWMCLQAKASQELPPEEPSADEHRNRFVTSYFRDDSRSSRSRSDFVFDSHTDEKETTHDSPLFRMSFNPPGTSFPGIGSARRTRLLLPDQPVDTERRRADRQHRYDEAGDGSKRRRLPRRMARMPGMSARLTRPLHAPPIVPDADEEPVFPTTCSVDGCDGSFLCRHRDRARHFLDRIDSYYGKDVFAWTNEDVCRWMRELEPLQAIADEERDSIIEAVRILGITGPHIVDHTCRSKNGEGSPLFEVLPPQHWTIVYRSFMNLMEFEALHHIEPLGLRHRISDLRRMRGESLPPARTPDADAVRPSITDEDRSIVFQSLNFRPPVEPKPRRKRRTYDTNVTQLDFRPEASAVSLDVSQAELQQFLEQRDTNFERQETEYQRFQLSREYTQIFRTKQSEASDLPPRNKKCVSGLWQLVCTEKVPWRQFPGPLPETIQVEIVWLLTGLKRRIESRALFRAMRSDLSSFSVSQATNCSLLKSEFLFIHRYRQSIYDTNYEAKQKDAFLRRLYGVGNLSDFQREREEKIQSRVNLSEPPEGMMVEVA